MLQFLSSLKSGCSRGAAYFVAARPGTAKSKLRVPSCPRVTDRLRHATAAARHVGRRVVVTAHRPSCQSSGLTQTRFNLYQAGPTDGRPAQATCHTTETTIQLYVSTKKKGPQPLDTLAPYFVLFAAGSETSKYKLQLVSARSEARQARAQKPRDDSRHLSPHNYQATVSTHGC